MDRGGGTEGERVFKALADGTRRQLLDVLAAGPRTTGELCERHPEMTRYGVMAHLKVLEQAGLVLVVRDGRLRYNHLNPVPIRQIYERWVRPIAELPATELTGLARVVQQRHRREQGDEQ
jgi:DNA-binding transcriptional ArsR family regulator